MMMMPDEVRDVMAYALTVCSAHIVKREDMSYDDKLAMAKRIDAAKELLDGLPKPPQPDWSQAPEWAEWWAVGPEGVQTWYEDEPRQVTYAWARTSDRIKTCGWNVIPLYIDWRVLKLRRPQQEEA